MKRTLFATLLAVSAGALYSHAEGGKDDVVAAAKKLAAAPCYSWRTTLDWGANAQFRPGPTEGKLVKDGPVWVSVSLRDNTAEYVIKGGKTALKLQDGWKTPAEVEADSNGGGGGGGGFNPGRMLARQAQAFKAPAALAEEIAGRTKSIEKKDGVFTGDLTEDGAKELLTFGRGGRRGGEPPQISDAKGSVKFWVKDGVLSKYETHVTGKISRGGNDVDADRTATTEIAKVGDTSVEIADEAKKKLE
jgi:hypothetical protein